MTAAHLDLAAIAIAITGITGHAQGTFEHESILGRVIAELAMGIPSQVRDDAGTVTTPLTREQFLVMEDAK